MNPTIEKRLKFLFISSDKFPPFRVDIAVLFGKQMQMRGHQIDYLLQSDVDEKKFYNTIWHNSRVFVGPTDNGTTIIRRLLKHVLSFINDLRMIMLLKTERYDFIQVRDKFIPAIIALILSKLTNRKFVFWLSYPFPEADLYAYKTGIARYPLIYYIRGNLLSFALYKIILPFADHVFVQSDKMKSDICSYGINSNKITPVPMGVDLDDYTELQKPITTSGTSNSPSIIYIGVMEKIRRIDFIIRVFKLVLDTVPDAKLYMVGGSSNASDIDDLRMEAERLSIGKSVCFTGFIPRLEALRHVKNSTICVSPIYPNPIYIPSSPTKLIEYMLMHKPVVANDIPEQLKIIEESNAGYCVKWDEASFANAIIELIKNPDKAQQMGRNGYEYVKLHRNYHVIADTVEKKYLELIP